ncbi:MAG: mechanosensitive ion channel family protein [Desulfobacterales bacterium]|nr:mechanosensitive ion channel family protein [Desulfobacterales bacterium]
MNDQVGRFQELGRLMQNHGLEMIIALVILIVGIFLTKRIVKKLREILDKFIKNAATVSIVVNSVGVLLLGLVITAAAMEVGARPGPLVAAMMIVVLATIGIIVIFRPLIPTLPFKVGNTVKAGNLLGKVEATTVLNTRLRTFDGKTFFVPNRQILDDIVINYHFTKTRRIKIDVTIRYDQDLIKAKQVLEALMIEDARILPKPNPQVYVLELGPNGVRLGGRCWVNNLKFWVTQCEMLEKTKLRFDAEGIRFAYNQLEVSYRKEEGDWTEDLNADAEMPEN